MGVFFFNGIRDKSKTLQKLWFKIHYSLVVRGIFWERQAQFSSLTHAEEGVETNLQPPKGQMQLPIDGKVVIFVAGAFCEAPT